MCTCNSYFQSIFILIPNPFVIQSIFNLIQHTHTHTIAEVFVPTISRKSGPKISPAYILHPRGLWGKPSRHSSGTTESVFWETHCTWTETPHSRVFHQNPSLYWEHIDGCTALLHYGKPGKGMCVCACM